MYKVILSSLVLTIFVTPAFSQKLDSQHKDWNVFTIDQNDRKVCYMTSSPTKQAGNYRRRGEPYFLVTYRGEGVAEISVSSGYPYKNESEVKLNIDDNKVTSNLFTTKETPRISWARDADEDKRLIEEMKKGTNITINGESRLKTTSTDTYSLSGFSSAYDKIVKLCSK